MIQFNLLGIIIPMPMPINNGGGGDPNIFIALLIVLNMLFFLIYLFMSIKYFFKKNKTGFLKYLFFDNYDDEWLNITTICVMATDGFAVIAAASIWLANQL